MSKIFKMSKGDLEKFKEDIFTVSKSPEEMEKRLSKYTYEELSSASILISLENMINKYEEITEDHAEEYYKFSYGRRIANKLSKEDIIYNIICEHILNGMAYDKAMNQLKECFVK